MPRHLVIDTATATCSVALIDGDSVIAALSDRVGRGHAERLIPMIASLPNGGRAGSILVNCGPGSFTGVRVGLAAARGLGLAWGVPVVGYSTHALIAASAFAKAMEDSVTVIMEGGHGEVFVQSFTARPFAALAPLVSCIPGAVERFGLTLGNAKDVDHFAEPVAAEAIHLPEAYRTLAPVPIYGRAPDAKPNPQ
jgi:tRNA threonylcarbamoyladenosine biosynthesis protein TsaB